MNSGQEAEDKVAKHLSGLGWRVVARNWKTPRCEIDIVARRGDQIYFVEVKYRKTDTQGSGLEYITRSKLQQMTLAAETWVHEHNWEGGYQLAAVEVSGSDFRVGELVTDF